MKRVYVVLMFVFYVAIVSWLGYHTMSADLKLMLGAPDRAWLIVAGEVVLYALSALATVWFVRLLYRFAYKLAADEEIDILAPNRQALTVLLADFYCRTAAAGVSALWNTAIGVSLFSIPLGIIMWLTMRDPCLRGIRKLMAGIPLYLYVIADTCLATWTLLRPT